MACFSTLALFSYLICYLDWMTMSNVFRPWTDYKWNKIWKIIFHRLRLTCKRNRNLTEEIQLVIQYIKLTLF